MNNFFQPLISEPTRYDYDSSVSYTVNPTEIANVAPGVASGYLGKTIYNDWNVITVKGKSISGGIFITSFECTVYRIGCICFLDIFVVPVARMFQATDDIETNLMENLPWPLSTVLEHREFGDKKQFKFTVKIDSIGTLSLTKVGRVDESSGTYDSSWQVPAHICLAYPCYMGLQRIYNDAYLPNEGANIHLNRFSNVTEMSGEYAYSEPMYNSWQEAMTAGKEFLDTYYGPNGSSGTYSFPEEPYTQPSNGEHIIYVYKVWGRFDASSGLWAYTISRETRNLGKSTLNDVQPSNELIT